MSINIDNFI